MHPTFFIKMRYLFQKSTLILIESEYFSFDPKARQNQVFRRIRPIPDHPGIGLFSFCGIYKAFGNVGFVWFFPGFAALRAGSWDHFDIFLESSGCLDYNDTQKPDFGGKNHEENIDNCYAALDDREPDRLRQTAKRCP